jgi:hypothetical protein
MGSILEGDMCAGSGRFWCIEALEAWPHIEYEILRKGLIKGDRIKNGN